MFGRYKCWILVFALFIGWGNLKAQLKSVITHYSTADGLSNNKVWNIIKDDEGFMWMATWSGLNRFDGHNFITFKTSPGDKSALKNDRIQELVDDKNGNLWTRAYDKQVYLFDKNTQVFTPLSQLLNQKELEKFAFSKILHVSESSVWLAAENQGVFLIRKTKDGSYNYVRFSSEMKGHSKLPSNEILFFHIDANKNAWIGTSRGLSIISKNNERSIQAVADGIGSLVCNNIKETKNGFWLGTRQGYLIYIDTDLNKVSKFKISGGGINGLLMSRHKKVLYCTTSLGEVVFVSLAGSVVNKSVIPSKSSLHAIYEDKTGLLWIE